MATAGDFVMATDTRGYRTTANLIAMTYLIAGKLDMASAHTR